MNINNYIGEDLKSGPYSQRTEPRLHPLAQTDSPDQQDASSKGGDYFLRESLPQDFLMDLSHGGGPLIGS